MNYWILCLISIVLIIILYIVYKKVQKERWLRVVGGTPLGAYIVLYNYGSVDYSKVTMEVVVMGNNRIKNTVRIVGNNTTNILPIAYSTDRAFTLTGMGLIDLVPNGYDVYPIDTQPNTDLHILEIRIWNTGLNNLQLYVYNHRKYWSSMIDNEGILLNNYEYYQNLKNLPSFERIIFYDTNVAWKHTYTEYSCDEDTNKCIRCKYNYSGTGCNRCYTTFTGANCDTCIVGFTGTYCNTCSSRFTGTMCNTCTLGFTGVNCDTCSNRFTGVNCSTCTGNFVGVECSTCKRGFTGANCDTCSSRFTGVNCDTCTSSRFTGVNCDTCTSRFIGVNCDNCNVGWTGVECDTCANRFTGANCDSCVNNWTIESDCLNCPIYFDLNNNCTGCRGGWTGSNCMVCMTGWEQTYCISCDMKHTGVKCDTLKTTYWNSKASIPNTGNTDMVTGTYGDTIVLIGSSIYKYSITSNTWTMSTFTSAWNGTTAFNMTGYNFSRGSSYWQVGSIIYMYCPYVNISPYYLQKMYTYDISTGKITELLSRLGTSLSPGTTNQYGTTWKDNNNNLWLFGGSPDYWGNSPSVNTLYVFSTNTGTWSTVTATNKPSARVGMKACTLGNITYLFGGGSTNDFYSFDNVGTFTVLNPSVKPTSRNYTCMWIIGTYVYLYGGYVTWSTGDSNMWRYDTGTRVWEKLSSGYSLDIRTSASVVVTGTNNVWILGGVYGTRLNTDVWTTIV